MKIPAVMKGRRYSPQPDDVMCPYGFHYHVGDRIEIALEMILCFDQAQKALERMR